MDQAANRGSGYHHGDLRNALEQAALSLVTEKGVHGFTLAEASRRAGVSVAAPFKHFAGKDALLAALVLRGYREQADRFREAISTSTDPVEQLAEFAAAYVQFAVDRKALFEITFSAGLDKRAYPDLEDAGRTLLDVLTAPARALRVDADDASTLVYAVAAVAHGFAAFLGEAVFGDPQQALKTVKSQAREAARALAGFGPTNAG